MLDYWESRKLIRTVTSIDDSSISSLAQKSDPETWKRQVTNLTQGDVPVPWRRTPPQEDVSATEFFVWRRPPRDKCVLLGTSAHLLSTF